MPRGNLELDDNDEVMQRCRRVRQELYRNLKTADQIYAWLLSLEKEGGPRHGRARSRVQRRRTAEKTAGARSRSRLTNGRAKAANKRSAQKA